MSVVNIVMNTKEEDDRKQGCDAKTCNELMAEMKSIHKELEEMHKLLDNDVDVSPKRVKRVETNLGNVQTELNTKSSHSTRHNRENKKMEEVEQSHTKGKLSLKELKNRKGIPTLTLKNQLGKELHDKLKSINAKNASTRYSNTNPETMISEGREL